MWPMVMLDIDCFLKGIVWDKLNLKNFQNNFKVGTNPKIFLLFRYIATQLFLWIYNLNSDEAGGSAEGGRKGDGSRNFSKVQDSST